jgi:DNA-binding beta-propeller fold protein YncE
MPLHSFNLVRSRGTRCAWWVAAILALTVLPASALRDHSRDNAVLPPEILLEGGRSLAFERTIESEKDVQGKQGFWHKVLDIVAGEPTYHGLVQPYGVVVDSRGRIIVTDPGAKGIHIFDMERNKYKFLSRVTRRERLLTPQCVAVDSSDRIYVTDSESGDIFVFEASGKFLRTIGSIKGGEGYFKRPTGIAVDPVTGNIFVSDTLRNKIFVLSESGEVLRTIGEMGAGPGQFYFPTELRIHNNELIVVDAMNFRVQRLGLDGTVKGTFGEPGDALGTIFRPKGVAVDSEGHIYLVEGIAGIVQVFDQQGELLYYFGKRGVDLTEFQLPTGLFIDKHDRVFVVDSYNQRVQVFHYQGLAKQGAETK